MTRLKVADLKAVQYTPANARRAYRLRRKVARGEQLDAGERAWLDGYAAANPGGVATIARRKSSVSAPAPVAHDPAPAPAPPPRDADDVGAVVAGPPPLTVTGITDEQAPPPAAPAAPDAAAAAPAAAPGPPPLVVGQPAAPPDPAAVAARARTIQQVAGFATGVLLKWDAEIAASGRASFGEEYLRGMFAPSLVNVLDHFLPQEVSVWGDVAVVGVTGVTMFRVRRQIAAPGASGPKPAPRPAPPAPPPSAAAADNEAPPSAAERAAPWL